MAATEWTGLRARDGAESSPNVPTWGTSTSDFVGCHGEPAFSPRKADARVGVRGSAVCSAIGFDDNGARTRLGKRCRSLPDNYQTAGEDARVRSEPHHHGCERLRRWNFLCAQDE